jgi:hypothetical protein
MGKAHSVPSQVDVYVPEFITYKKILLLGAGETGTQTQLVLTTRKINSLQTI